jgi:transcriptional regulator with XRE-family HTH domain
MNLAIQWGRAIKAQRQLAKLSQDELAAKCGVSQATVSRWEKGEHAPSHFHIPKIASALGTVPSVLFQYPMEPAA